MTKNSLILMTALEQDLQAIDNMWSHLNRYDPHDALVKRAIDLCAMIRKEETQNERTDEK